MLFHREKGYKVPVPLALELELLKVLCACTSL